MNIILQAAIKIARDEKAANLNYCDNFLVLLQSEGKWCQPDMVNSS